MTFTLTGAPRVTADADEVLRQAGMWTNPYLTDLTAGSMPLEAFRSSQEQFGFAVTYFARPMAALISRIEDPHDRLGILRNIVEEHGDFAPQHFHHTTFRRFLASIGSRDSDHLDTLEITPAVHAFNSVLASACSQEHVTVAVCCMGVIEHAFARISATIGQAVVQHGWVGEDDLVHYDLHAEIDERHAEDFFVLVEPAATTAGVGRGLRLGAYAFNRLYTDLHTHAATIQVR